MTKYSADQADQTLVFGTINYVRDIIAEQVPVFRNDLPGTSGVDVKFYKDEDIVLASFHFKEHGITTTGSMEKASALQLKQIIGSERTYEQLRKLGQLADFFSWNKTLIIADIHEGLYDSEITEISVVSWLNEFALPRAVEMNKTRVQAAIPTPPQYSFEVIEKALWVLEHQETYAQGTAFELADTGIITNQHVIEGKGQILAFKVSDTVKKFPVEVVKQNAALDLAIIRIQGVDVQHALYKGDTDLKQMEHVLVCGFPNYRYGDSGIFSPGLIVGTRMKSGVCRLLTNAGIVAGMSGGPAIGSNNQVVGICVTGSDFMQGGRDNEDQSIIPISALEILLA